MIYLMELVFNTLNHNSYFIGLMMIMLNLGTKYLMQEFGFIIDYIFSIQLIRRLMLFAVFFVATRNIKVSIILTGVFILITLELFNEKSKNCLISKSWLENYKKKKEEEFKNEEIKISIDKLKKYGVI